MGIKNTKRGQMEMSMGTIVTIVLLVIVLVLGIFFIQKIFNTGSNVIDQVDTSVNGQLSTLFGQDQTKQIVFYPSNQMTINKGSSGGFAFSLRNTEKTDGVFSYTISVQEIGSDCTMTKADAAKLIILGGTGANINIPSGSFLDQGIFVKFDVPSSAPLCDIRYGLDVQKDGQTYIPTVSVDLTIK